MHTCYFLRSHGLNHYKCVGTSKTKIRLQTKFLRDIEFKGILVIFFHFRRILWFLRAVGPMGESFFFFLPFSFPYVSENLYASLSSVFNKSRKTNDDFAVWRRVTIIGCHHHHPHLTSSPKTPPLLENEKSKSRNGNFDGYSENSTSFPSFKAHVRLLNSTNSFTWLIRTRLV